jgi:hypothetical protein
MKVSSSRPRLVAVSCEQSNKLLCSNELVPPKKSQNLQKTRSTLIKIVNY